ncbi:MAG: hypothetical protein D6722_27940 [Bacteroidetes bacterium]|nr:MAG: hypothetical protein D6722_27940 [Bacteroidota bacterium]
MFIDHYQTLGLKRDASEAEIKAAFRELAMQYHPDHNTDPAAHQQFIQIREAYQVLSHPLQKRKYDYQHDRHHGRAPSGSHPSGGQSALELTRRKRASRYNRSHYSQRVRYRGTATSADTHEASSRTRERERSGSYRYSEAYARSVIAEHENTLLGYRYYARAVRVLSGLLILFCLGMLLDAALVGPTGTQTVQAHRDLPKAYGRPLLTEVQTAYRRFLVHRRDAHLVGPGRPIRILRAPFSGLATGVQVQEGNRRIRIRTYGGLYDSGMNYLWVVVVLGLITLYFRQNPEYSAYLGTASLIVSMIILALFFYG